MAHHLVGIKNLGKKVVPRPIMLYGRQMTTSWALRKHSKKLGNPSIRKGTPDKKVFRDIFVFRDLDIPLRFKPQIIVDAGAYAGFSTLFYATKYPKANIIAIEPEGSNFLQLGKNTQSLANVTRVNAGLWYKNAYLKVVDRHTGKWGFTVEEVSASEGYDIWAITINHLLDTYGYHKIDLLKIDIEGAEKELFSKNYQSWIGRVNAIVIELHDRIKAGCTEALYAAIDPAVWREYRSNEKVVLVRKAMIRS